MRRLSIPLAVAAALALPLAAPASAQTTDTVAPPAQQAADAPRRQPPSDGTQTAIEGRALGEHVSAHAPEHPREMGSLFGECVSELAITGTCPHADVDGLAD